YAVLVELRAGDGEAVRRVPVPQPGLRIQPDLTAANALERRPHQIAAQPTASRPWRHEHPADPRPLAVVEDARVRHQGALRLAEQVAGGRLAGTSREVGRGRARVD